MGLDINTISDATLRKVATKYAQDNDLSKQEFQKMISTEKGLAERLSEGGVSELKKMEFDLDDSGAWTKFNREDWSAQMARKAGMDTVADWLDGSNNKCTDGKDDGKISLKEGAKSFGIGLLGIVKDAVNHPLATAGMVAGGAALVVLTGGAALVPMIAVGATVGVTQIGVGAYKAATAKTDREAKEAWETIGTGTSVTALSVLSAKSALNQASNAGVTSAEGAENMNALEATVQCFRSTPEAVMQSGRNIKGNVLTLTKGTVHTNSNKLNNAETVISKDGKTETNFKILKKGTKFKTNNGEEVLADKSIVIIGEDGQLSQTTVSQLLNNNNLSEVQLTLLEKIDPVAVELYKNPNGFLSTIPQEYQEIGLKYIKLEEGYYNALKNSPKSADQGILYRLELQGGREANIKSHILDELGVKMAYWSNDYNGPDPLVGHIYNGNFYSLEKYSCNFKGEIDLIFEQLMTKNFPKPSILPENCYYR